MTDARRHEALARASRDWPSWTLTPRQRGDLELISSGAYAPLTGFMIRGQTPMVPGLGAGGGAAFPAPVRLDVSEAAARDAETAGHLVLRDPEGVALAVLDVVDSWRDGPHFVGGPITRLQAPAAVDPVQFFDAADVQREIRGLGWTTVVAFPTRGFIHRPDDEAIRTAIARVDAGALVLALSDPAEDDARRFVRMRSLEAAQARYPRGRIVVRRVPLAAREHAADEALLTAVIARNAGATHLLTTDRLEDDARQRLDQLCRQIGVELVHRPVDRTAEGRMRADGRRLPDSYAFPDVADALAVLHPPKHRRGFTLFFTGLSGSGKSTIASVVRRRLLERTGRPVTLLDGDLVRLHLSSELGFSREHRDLNIRRIAFVASEITRHGGIAICAPIAPYEAVRQEARRAIEAVGGFVLVFVDTPLEVCEARDRKGLYAKARAGMIREFTGISDPYERPADADIVIRTSEESADAAATRILGYLEQQGYLLPGDTAWAR